MKLKSQKLVLIIPFLFLLIFFGLGIAANVSAGAVTIEETGLETTAGQAGLPQPELTALIGNIIRAAFSVVGVVFFILLLYGGFLWMTAGGNEEKVKKAKSLMVNSVIGLLIIIAAYAISEFVIRLLLGGEVFAPAAPIEE